jgi:hypothetical protein
MSSGVVLGFSPNDFFFVKAEQTKEMPSKSKCDNLSENPPQNCDVSPTQECMNYELCKNKSNANILYNLQNKYGGFDQKHSDGLSLYSDTLLNTFNLGIGIVIAMGFIYTKYIYKPKLQ